jgi:hypothetical protein
MDTPGSILNMLNSKVLPFRTGGIMMQTVTKSRIDDIEEIPSRTFSSFPLNITPRVPMRGMSRAMSSSGE